MTKYIDISSDITAVVDQITNNSIEQVYYHFGVYYRRPNSTNTVNGAERSDCVEIIFNDGFRVQLISRIERISCITGMQFITCAMDLGNTEIPWQELMEAGDSIVDYSNSPIWAPARSQRIISCDVHHSEYLFTAPSKCQPVLPISLLPEQVYLETGERLFIRCADELVFHLANGHRVRVFSPVTEGADEAYVFVAAA